MGLFGPTKDEVWIELSEEINGKWEGCTFLKSSRVEVLHRNWTITLDSHNGGNSSYTTYMRVPFVNRSGFRFEMSPQTGFSEILISLGMKDVQIGVPEFDEKYVLKGSNDDQVRQLFMNDRIQSLISKMPEFAIFSYNSSDWDYMGSYEISMLQVRRSGLVKDIEFLKLLFELFKEVLDTMSLYGFASDETPKYKL